MGSDILIGIDLGTTNLKAAAFDADSGSVLAGASRRLAVHVDADGTREQQLGSVRQGLGQVFAELRSCLGSAWEGVSGIGLAAQGGSGAIVDRAGGEPHTPMVLWNDSRAFRCLPEIAALKSDQYWRDLSWRRGPGSGLAKLLWLQRTHPGVMRPGRMYVGAGEYVYYLMTGVWCQDACNALQMGCYSVSEDRLEAEPLALVGISIDAVAPLRNGHETHALSASGARLLGLSPGLPVAGPYMDHEAGYLSSAAVSARPLQCSLGTAWVGNFVVSTTATGGSPVQLVIPAPAGTGRLVIQPLLTGNVTWDWGLTVLVDSDHATALSRVGAIFEQDLLPPDGLLALPWLTQASPLGTDTLGAGAFFGLGAHCDRRQMLRALAAGLVYEFYRVFEDLKRVGAVDSIVLGGGASKGAFFRTMLASLFEPLPVYSLCDEDLAGARGTLHGLNARASCSEPAAVAPAGRGIRERLLSGYGAYRRLFDCLYGAVPSGAPYSFG